MAEADKHIQRAEKYLAKNRLDAAIEEYKAAFAAEPANLNHLQTVGDLYARLDQKGEAVRVYAELFDKAVEKHDSGRAVRVFARLQDTPQPPERHATYADLLMRQRKNPEAIKAYKAAIELYEKGGKAEEMLQCLEKIALLEPDSPVTQVRLAEQADKMGKTELAAKGHLRAGQLVRPDDIDEALRHFQRAHELAPDRSTALHLAEVNSEKGNHSQVAELLLPIYAEGEEDATLLRTLAGSLIAENRLAEAEEVIGVLHRMQPESFELFFVLADGFCKQDNSAKVSEILTKVKDLLVQAKREKEFAERLDKLYEANPSLLSLGEFAAAFFAEINQDTRYEEALGKLFETYREMEDYEKAANALDRLIDIDAYDYKNQDRLKTLQGKLEEKRFRDVAGRISADFAGTEEDAAAGGGGASAESQSLDDMMVQVELFVQYNLRPKAVEKLQQIAKSHPGEEARNSRLARLYEMVDVAPPTPPAGAAPVAGGSSAPPAGSGGGSISDLAKISEITHLIYRQGSPKEILHKAVTELGRYLKSSRCLGVLGRPGKPPSVAVEFCSPGVPQSPPAAIVKMLDQVFKLNLDKETGAVVDANLSPELKVTGALSLFAMPLIDTEKSEQEGVIVLSQADHARQWNPNEVYLVKAVADQAQAAISHTKLRSLMKNLAVGEMGGGLLGRSVYLDTLVSVVGRSLKQGTPLVIALFELDKGAQLTRAAGEASIEKLMTEAGELLLSQVRQNDLAFRYTGTALAVVMGDTTLEKSKPAVEKLRKILCGVKLTGQNGVLSFSAGACEAVIRPDHDAVDIVCDVANRAQFSLEAARQKGNAVTLA